jgi:hypothetical protein
MSRRSNLPRALRAFVLALVLPALLAPSGWAWRLCFCDSMLLGGLVHREVAAPGEELDSCCQPKPEKRSCCEGELAGATQDEPEQDPSDCNECRMFDAGNAGLASFAAPEVPTMAPPTVVAWVVAVDAAPTRAPRALELVCRAPPGVGRLLPLRI